MSQMNDCRLTLAVIALAVFGALPASGQTINEDFKLTASDGLGTDYTGWSIAIDNGVIAVGALLDDENGADSGSAYLFDASTGAQLFKLLPSDGMGGDLFGSSLAIDNGVVAVGAMFDDENGRFSGSAYLFDASTGAQLFKLLPNDGAAGDEFGRSIAIANGIVAVGAWHDSDNGGNSGSAYLFDASTGAQLFKLLPSDGMGGDQFVGGDQFGYSIAIDSGVVAVGAYGDDDNGSASGSAYLFDASTGAQLFKLLPSDGLEGDQFGYSIAIDSGAVAVGAPGDDDNGITSGSAYLFDASTGGQITKLLPSDGAAGDQFGNSIAIANGIVAIGGASGADGNGFRSGSAYVFKASTGGQIAKLLPSDGAVTDQFGLSIGIDNGVVAVGARSDAVIGPFTGSAYLFTPASPCLADLNGDGILDNGDISTFITLFLAGDLAADLNADGILDNGDIGAFVNLFLAGC